MVYIRHFSGLQMVRLPQFRSYSKSEPFANQPLFDHLLSGRAPFFSIRPPPELLPVLGPQEQYMTPTLDAALLYSSRAGSDLGRLLDRFYEELCQLGFLIHK